MESIVSKMVLPEELHFIIENTKVIFAEDREDLFKLAMGKKKADFYEVYYNIPNMGKIVECTVARCKNGVAVNYTDPYMRRRDPNCMLIADDYPTDKETFKERFGYEFSKMRQETIQWFSEQPEVMIMPFYAGGKKYGYPAIVIAPPNAAFFAASLGDLQEFIPKDEVPDNFEPEAILYVAPPFRHTHCNSKQVVVHNRTEKIHEVFSYNLYPGPSAKKGCYGVLLTKGEKDGWITNHSSAVKVTTPYENLYTIMHEGASGGGKSEMLEQLHRDLDGRIKLGTNLVTGEEYHIELAENSRLEPVTDDMALAHPDFQNGRKLVISDAESGWFLRVDHIKHYGTEIQLEELTIHPQGPMVFYNIDAAPNSTALIWEHTMDAPGKPCPNPRVVVPRSYFPTQKGEIVEVDLRSFGVRTPPMTKDHPTYGVVGLFHVLSPSLAWLWRLVSPRGHANPSITDSEGMSSEGVGSYWPFATGKMVDQANLLLRQIVDTPETRFVLMPNQHIGAYHVGFMSEWVAREYLSRRGNARFRSDEIKPSKCALLGYTMKKMKLDGNYIPRTFLDVSLQPEVGQEAYDKGTAILENFFRKQLSQFMTDELDPLGRKIIDAFMNGASVEEFNEFIPFKSIY